MASFLIICAIIIVIYLFSKGRSNHKQHPSYTSRHQWDGEFEPKSAPRKNVLGVNSFSSSLVYLIDMSSLSCTCQDWKDRRAGFRDDDPRRMCKHLIRQYFITKQRFPKFLDKYQQNLSHYAKGGKGYLPFSDRKFIEIDGEKIELFIPTGDLTSSWVPVYCNGKSYVFEANERRWGGDMLPLNSAIIESNIPKLITNTHISSSIHVVNAVSKVTSGAKGSDSSEYADSESMPFL